MTKTLDNELHPITFDRFKASFERRQSHSKAPAILLDEEIKHIERLLDSNAPRVPFNHCDLIAVRKAFKKHIIEGDTTTIRYARAKEGDDIALWATGPQPPTADPFEFDFSNARKYKLMPPSDDDIKALNTAVALFDYLKWLRELVQPDTTEITIRIEQDQPEATEPEPTELIVRRGCLELIWDKYKDYFKGETPESWLRRFEKGDISMPQMKVDSSSREGSNRLVLIAILASIQVTTGNAFDFAKYASSHFGIEGLESSKTRHKEKRTYKETKRYCDGILNK